MHAPAVHMHCMQESALFISQPRWCSVGYEFRYNNEALESYGLIFGLITDDNVSCIQVLRSKQ